MYMHTHWTEYSIVAKVLITPHSHSIHSSNIAGGFGKNDAHDANDYDNRNEVREDDWIANNGDINDVVGKDNIVGNSKFGCC